MKAKGKQYFDKGVSLYNDLNYEECIKMFEKSIKLGYNIPESYVNKGLALNKLNRPDEAIPFFDKALQINPGSHLAYNNKGSSYYAKRNYDEAIINFEKSLEINPDFNDAKINKELSRIYKNITIVADVIYKRDYQNEDQKRICATCMTQEEYTRYNEALLFYEKALEIRANYPEYFVEKQEIPNTKLDIIQVSVLFKEIDRLIFLNSIIIIINIESEEKLDKSRDQLIECEKNEKVLEMSLDEMTNYIMSHEYKNNKKGRRKKKKTSNEEIQLENEYEKIDKVEDDLIENFKYSLYKDTVKLDLCNKIKPKFTNEWLKNLII